MSRALSSTFSSLSSPDNLEGPHQEMGLNLFEMFSPSIDKVNAKLTQLSKSSVNESENIAGHIFAAGGKRTRPVLCMVGTLLAGGEITDDVITLAATIECIHTATLLHDDVIDNGQVRRGRKTPRYIWGNRPSILVGDYLIAHSLSHLLNTDNLNLMKLVTSLSKDVIVGELEQQYVTGAIPESEAGIVRVIELKTARMFEMALGGGALLAGAAPEVQKALSQCGKYIGLSFQLLDDLLDYIGDPKILEKKPGKDFQEQVCTLPMFYAYEGALKNNDKNALAFWRRTMIMGDQASDDFKKAVQYLNDYQAIETCHAKAREFTDLAIKLLDVLPDSDLKAALISFTRQALARMR